MHNAYSRLVEAPSETREEDLPRPATGTNLRLLPALWSLPAPAHPSSSGPPSLARQSQQQHVQNATAVYHTGCSDEHRALKFLYDMELVGEGRYLGYVEASGAVILVGSDERTQQVGLNAALMQGLHRCHSGRMVDEVAGEAERSEPVSWGGG